MRQGCLVLALVVASAFVAVQPAASQWILDLEPNHSTVAFSVPIVGGLTTVTGNFRDFDVNITFNEEDITRSSVTATIKAYSIDTGIDMRDKDLRGPKFFDVSNHPEITFRSRRIEKRGEGYVAVGHFSMRGVTKEVELPFVITGLNWSGEEKHPSMGIAAEWKLNRQDYGVGSDWQHSAIPNFVGDEVTIQIFMWTRPGRKPETSGDG